MLAEALNTSRTLCTRGGFCWRYKSLSVFTGQGWMIIKGFFPQLNHKGGLKRPLLARKMGCSEGNLLICLQVSTVCVFDRQNMLAEALNTSRTLFT